MRQQIRAFLLGCKEWRSGVTTHFDYPLIETYDWGREIMHRITFRRYEQ